MAPTCVACDIFFLSPLIVFIAGAGCLLHPWDFEDRAGKVPAPDIFLSLRNSSYGMVSFGSQETRAPDKTFGLQCFRKWDRSWSPSQARVCLGPLHSSGFVNGSDGYFMLLRTSPFDLRWWLLWLPWLPWDLLQPQLQTHLPVAVRFRAP